MFDQYFHHCRAGLIDIGNLWLYKLPADAREQRWVLNFPTKRHWKYPFKVEYLETGLEKSIATYQGKGITSIAIPLLGAANGGLTEEASLSTMQQYLSHCRIPVEIYRYDPTVTDDLYEEFRSIVLHIAKQDDDKTTAKAMYLRIDLFRKFCEVLEWKHEVNSLSQLASEPGIGLKTLEKCFRYVMDGMDTPETALPTLI